MTYRVLETKKGPWKPPVVDEQFIEDAIAVANEWAAEIEDGRKNGYTVWIPSVIDVYWETIAQRHANLLGEKYAGEPEQVYVDCECNMHCGVSGCNYRELLPDEWVAFDGDHDCEVRTVVR